MAFEQTDNTGAVFVNDRKQEDAHPDRTGSALIDGRPYYVNGWLRKTKDGQTYLALSFKRKDAKPADKSKSRAEMADEVPF